jgi:glycogen debranching enzyme
MTSSLLAAAARDVRVRPDKLLVASGWSLLITDPLGRISGTPTAGFYVDNTRVLAHEQICVDGQPVEPFTCARVGSHALVADVELGKGEVVPPRALYLTVERSVADGLRTRLRFTSHSNEAAVLQVSVDLSADFADIDEVEKGERQQTGAVTSHWDEQAGELTFRYGRTGLDRAVLVSIRAGKSVVGEPVVGAAALRFEVTLEPRATATVEYVTEPVFDGHRRAAPEASCAEGHDGASRAREAIRGDSTTLTTTNPDVALAWRTAVEDLSALALGEPSGPAAPMAGLPLYQQVFGRDMLTVSWQALLATDVPLRDSLLVNAHYIGRCIDDWHDEEPGKMLHQARRGPLAALERDPLGRYYGDWATVPDFLVFVGQYYAWTGGLDTVRSLLPAVRSALHWLERYADLDGDGFLEYDTRSKQGVKNQGWKDSADALVDEHGNIVDNPVAASELQGYHYAALRHAAVVLAACGDRAYAAELWRRSRRLQKRFHNAFWLPDQHCYAMALGPDKRPVRSVNSNDGHLLVSGIVPRHAAAAVARRLLAPDMFSGWGIRTLSADHPVYNPYSYHRGSVWPVEQGTAALGLARYGCWEQLHRLAGAFFDCAAMFAEHRLPEAIGGHPRDERHPYPSIYPKACSPQAWSASSVVAMVQALLALRPAAPSRTLLVDPHLPPWLPELTLTGVRLGPATMTLHAHRHRDGSSRVRVVDSTHPVAVLHQPARHTGAGPVTRSTALARTSLRRGTRRPTS